MRTKYLHPSSFWYATCFWLWCVVPDKSYCVGWNDDCTKVSREPAGERLGVFEWWNHIWIISLFCLISWKFLLGYGTRSYYCLRMILTSWFSMYHLTKNKIYGVSATVIHLTAFSFSEFSNGRSPWWKLSQPVSCAKRARVKLNSFSREHRVAQIISLRAIRCKHNGTWWDPI